MQNKVREFWEKQSEKGIASGTRDLILDSLEREVISSYMTNDSSVLEVGCGDGRTSIYLKTKNDISITAFDYAEGMVRKAKKNARISSVNGIVFFVLDLNEVDQLEGKFDYVISKRVLINLRDYQEQVAVIKKISHVLAPGGTFLMCESSKRGLSNINKLRKLFNLKEISSPWHNTYIDDNKLIKENLPLELIERKDFTSTYYFLSRIVNAHISDLEGKEPEYDSPINQMALQLPPIGEMGQTVLWVWRKNS